MKGQTGNKTTRERIVWEHDSMCSQSLNRSAELQQDILIKWGVRHLKCSQRHQGVLLGERSTTETTCAALEIEARGKRALAVPTVSLMQLAQQMLLQPTAFIQEMRNMIYNLASKARTLHQKEKSQMRPLECHNGFCKTAIKGIVLPK